jgi:hypothetical protein
MESFGYVPGHLLLPIIPAAGGRGQPGTRERMSVQRSSCEWEICGRMGECGHVWAWRPGHQKARPDRDRRADGAVPCCHGTAFFPSLVLGHHNRNPRVHVLEEVPGILPHCNKPVVILTVSRVHVRPLRTIQDVMETVVTARNTHDTKLSLLHGELSRRLRLHCDAGIRAILRGLGIEVLQGEERRSRSGAPWGSGPSVVPLCRRRRASNRPFAGRWSRGRSAVLAPARDRPRDSSLPRCISHCPGGP